MTGTVIGYDPGGNGKHGVARAKVEDGRIVCVITETLNTVEEVLGSICKIEQPLLGIGIDTLTCWATGPSGWRPADRWLRERYPAVKKAFGRVKCALRSHERQRNGIAVFLAPGQPRHLRYRDPPHGPVLRTARAEVQGGESCRQEQGPG